VSTHVDAKVTVCVMGATGYTGAETLRWVLGHPRLRLVGATAQSHAGKPLTSVWPQFASHTDVMLTADPAPADVTFLCLPHGEASRRAPDLGGIVIDLSGDHRIEDAAAHLRWYGFERAHDAWVYGLPELGLDRVRGATRIANPGCFATALALTMLPMRGRLPARVQATGLTGSTGSGNKPTDTTHHPARDENVRPYKVLQHQHVPEVVQALGGGFALDFVPMSAPLRRGILVSTVLPGATLADYRAFYAGNPLVRVQSTPPDLLGVLGSARADLSVVEADGTSVVFCAIDNLCRGAGSQAVANLNLAMGWDYDLGLRTLAPIP
jgi:N-acetyl-gamma-glutamyl-phosphate reductase